MSLPAYIPVREVMRKEVTFVNGRTNVFEALRIMKKVQATCLIVEKRHENDESRHYRFLPRIWSDHDTTAPHLPIGT